MVNILTDHQSITRVLGLENRLLDDCPFWRNYFLEQGLHKLDLFHMSVIWLLLLLLLLLWYYYLFITRESRNIFKTLSAPKPHVTYQRRECHELDPTKMVIYLALAGGQNMTWIFSNLRVTTF